MILKKSWNLMTGYHGLAKCSTTLLWQLCACVSLAHIAVMVKSAPLTELIIYFSYTFNILLEGQWKSTHRAHNILFTFRRAMEIRSKMCEHEILHWMVSIPDSISFQEIAEHSSSPEYGCTATFLYSQIEKFTEITYFEHISFVSR